MYTSQCNPVGTLYAILLLRAIILSLDCARFMLPHCLSPMSWPISCSCWYSLMLYAIRFLREIGLKRPSVPEPKWEDPLPILRAEDNYHFTTCCVQTFKYKHVPCVHRFDRLEASWKSNASNQMLTCLVPRPGHRSIRSGPSDTRPNWRPSRRQR